MDIFVHVHFQLTVKVDIFVHVHFHAQHILNCFVCFYIFCIGLNTFIFALAASSVKLWHRNMHFYHRSLLLQPEYLRAHSQIPVYGLTGRALGGRLAVLGAGFCGQNLGIKCIPCVGTHLWITMAAKSTLSYCQIYRFE